MSTVTTKNILSLGRPAGWAVRLHAHWLMTVIWFILLDRIRTPSPQHWLANCKATFSVCDVTDHDQVRQSVADAGQHRRSGVCGRIHCAQTPKGHNTEALHNALATNATGALIAIQAQSRRRRLRTEVYCCFQQSQLEAGFANHGIVSMVKGAVEGLTRVL